MNQIVSQKLAIYYGWPSAVNATYTPALAAGVFSKYNLVVFGAGLEDVSHPDAFAIIAIPNKKRLSKLVNFIYIFQECAIKI